jgi:hypothetical protein
MLYSFQHEFPEVLLLHLTLRTIMNELSLDHFGSINSYRTARGYIHLMIPLITTPCISTDLQVRFCAPLEGTSKYLGNSHTDLPIPNPSHPNTSQRAAPLPHINPPKVHVPLHPERFQNLNYPLVTPTSFSPNEHDHRSLILLPSEKLLHCGRNTISVRRKTLTFRCRLHARSRQLCKEKYVRVTVF